MKFYSEVNITNMFEELDKSKTLLLIIKDNDYLVNYYRDYVNNLEQLLNNVIIVKE